MKYNESKRRGKEKYDEMLILFQNISSKRHDRFIEVGRKCCNTLVYHCVGMNGCVYEIKLIFAV